MGENICSYDEAFTIAEMLEETGLCKKCKLNCPNAGKSENKIGAEALEIYVLYGSLKV